MLVRSIGYVVFGVAAFALAGVSVAHASNELRGGGILQTVRHPRQAARAVRAGVLLWRGGVRAAQRSDAISQFGDTVVRIHDADVTIPSAGALLASLRATVTELAQAAPLRQDANDRGLWRLGTTEPSLLGSAELHVVQRGASDGRVPSAMLVRRIGEDSPVDTTTVSGAAASLPDPGMHVVAAVGATPLKGGKMDGSVVVIRRIDTRHRMQVSAGLRFAEKGTSSVHVQESPGTWRELRTVQTLPSREADGMRLTDTPVNAPAEIDRLLRAAPWLQTLHVAQTRDRQRPVAFFDLD